MQSEGTEPTHVVVAGAGIAGLEFAMALADLAGDRARITVVAPDSHFVLKPLVVRVPFGGPGLERHDITPALESIGAELVAGSLIRVDADAKRIIMRGATSMDYDMLAVCIGAPARPAYTAVPTFWSTSARLPVDDLLRQAVDHASRTLAVVVPPATTWPLPAYELALLLRTRAEELDLDPRIQVLTPEAAPLEVFGRDASAAVAGRLGARGVEVEPNARVVEIARELHRRDGALVDAGAAVALPRIDGPAIPGMPSERGGFIPIDEHCRVVGREHTYAAGDGTSFPVKQGGIATQQADAAAEHLAASLGAQVEVKPFRPVLRGELLTGADSIKLLHEINDGEEGIVSPDYLWWPRLKVGGRYLSAWLTGTSPQADREPREMPIEVEASWPHEWHGNPL